MQVFIGVKQPAYLTVHQPEAGQQQLTLSGELSSISQRLSSTSQRPEIPVLFSFFPSPFFNTKIMKSIFCCFFMAAVCLV